MYFSPEDDEDFSPSFGGGGKSNLSSLFGANQAAVHSGNESLTYTAPKQPKKPTAPSGQEIPAVLHAAAVQTFKFVNGQYATQGKLGAAILGSHPKKEYRLLLYASKKQQVTNAKITSTFSFVVQPNNYASFYDDARQSWSLRFDSLQQLIDFAKQVGLARYNAAPGSLIKQDLVPGDGQAIESGDIIEVKYTGSLWTNNSFGKVFDSNASADKSFKFRPGKGKVIKGWEDGVIGMKKGSKRLLAIPPELAYGDKGIPSRLPSKSSLLFEVEISRVKFAKEKTENVSLSSNDTSSPSSSSSSLLEQPQREDVPRKGSLAHSREEDDVRERTASLNKELSSSPEKGSDKAKLLARMSKMGGKNVLKLPGAVVASGDDEETMEGGEQHISEHETPTTAPEEAHTYDHHDPPAGNPHPHSPVKPAIPPRTANVNRIAHSTPVHPPPSSHVNHPQAPQHYHPEYQGGSHAPAPQQQVALYQPPPLLQAPPIYQQPVQYAFQQPPPPPFQQVFQQPAQPIFPSVAPVQASPQPSTSGGTSDAMMPLLMTESRQHQSEVRQAITKVSEKIDSLEQKVDLLKQSKEDNHGAIRPAVSDLSADSVMEASVLMNSIVKLVQENERMKKENIEKTAKVEGLNEKISELLHRSQRYVEQSNIFLEQRNESLQQSSSYSQSKLVELERDKTSMSTQLGAFKQNMATLEAELEILRKQDAENREQLQKTTSQMHKYKTEFSTTRETLTEKEEEFEKASSSLKNGKQERKKLEGKLSNLEDVLGDLKQEKESLIKNLTERKKKQQAMKKTLDEEMEEMKTSHEDELNGIKERYRRELTSSNSSVSQQLAESEADVEEKWQAKSKQMVNQTDKKWQRKYDELVEDCDALKKRVSQSDEKYATAKGSQNEHLREIKELQEKVKDLDDTQKKYHELRMRTVEMKEVYERRLEGVTKEREVAVREAYQKIAREKEESEPKQAEPSREKVVQQVKEIMNKVFFKIRGEFAAGNSYKGSAVLGVVLNVIKTMTLKLTSGVDDEESEDEEEDDDEEEEDEEEDEDEDEEEDEEEEVEEEEGVTGKLEGEKVEERKEDEGKMDEDNVDGVKHEHEVNVQTEKQLPHETIQAEQEIEEVVEEIGGDTSDEDQEQAAKLGEENEVEVTLVDSSVEVEKDLAISNSDSEGEQSEGSGNRQDERKEEETLRASSPDDFHEATGSGDVHSQDSVSQGDDSAESDYESAGDSDEAIRGSEADTDVMSEVASDEGNGETVVDNEEQREQRESVVADLPSLDELTVGDISQENLEDARDNEEQLGGSEVKDSTEDAEEQENVDIGDKETNSDDVGGGDKSSETKAKEKQSFTDLLSDSEDDVVGLFDTPVKKELSAKKEKTEEEASLKPTPPPLFGDDDDDDDDLEWLS